MPVLQHGLKFSFHASNICLITLNNIKWLTDNFNAFQRDFCCYKPKEKSQKRITMLNTPGCEVS